MQIIDTHAYYGENQVLGVNYTVDMLRRAKAGYDLKFVILSASPETNFTIADTVKENNDMLGAYLTIVPRKDLPVRYTSPDEINKLAERKEIKGLKLVTSFVDTSIDDEIVKPYAEVAKDNDIAFMFHCSRNGDRYTSYERNKRFIEENPEPRIIMAHFGGLHPNLIYGSTKLAYEHPNAYLNTAGLSGEMRTWDLSGGKLKEWYSDIYLRRVWMQILQKAMKPEISP